MRKKHSLVLKCFSDDDGVMNTNQRAGKAQRMRTFLRYAWGDQVAAHRAMLPPYDDYLINRRTGR
jgi:hypothetical protein